MALILYYATKIKYMQCLYFKLMILCINEKRKSTKKRNATQFLKL